MRPTALLFVVCQGLADQGPLDVNGFPVDGIKLNEGTCRNRHEVGHGPRAAGCGSCTSAGPARAPSRACSDIDAVLLSHLHHDHLDASSLRRFAGRPKIVIPRGAAGALRRRRFGNLHEIAPGERIGVGALAVTATPAAHDGRRLPVGPAIGANGYLVEGEGLRLYFAGDTAPSPDVETAVTKPDLALLPIGGWGPRLSDAHHLGPGTAAALAAVIQPRVVIPIHWGTLLRVGLNRRSDEILARPARDFAAELAEVAPSVELRTLEPGQSTLIGAAGSVSDARG